MTDTNKTSMSLVRKGLLGFCALSTVGLISIQPAFADCTRHFVNQTDKEWKINVIDNKKQADWVIVRPGETVAYTFIQSILSSSAARTTWSQQIAIFGPAPENYEQVFDLQQDMMSGGSCVYIKHSGNTGSATVNEPANGDLILWRAD